MGNFIFYAVSAMKLNILFDFYLKFSNAVISALGASTISHSIGHFNMGEYFLYKSKEKKRI